MIRRPPISTRTVTLLPDPTLCRSAYRLYLYRRVAFGVQKNADAAAMPDLNLREWLILGPIAAAVLWMGVYPESFMAPMRADIAALDARLARAAPQGDRKSTRLNSRH